MKLVAVFVAIIAFQAVWAMPLDPSQAGSGSDNSSTWNWVAYVHHDVTRAWKDISSTLVDPVVKIIRGTASASANDTSGSASS